MLQPIISEIANQSRISKAARSGENAETQTPADAHALEYLDDPLYVRLQSFAFDKPDASLPFSARLARNCMWTPYQADRVCEEYRKFVYLTCITDQTLTPSNDVDEAWHLHLTYTESYWNDLCGDILGRPLHHTPTEGGEEQLHFYRDCYVQTLQLYEAVFGQRPPADIWPDVDTRFQNADSMRMVDTSRFWIVRKIPAWVPQVAVMIFGVVAMALGWQGVGAEAHWSIPPALITIGGGSIAWSLFNAHISSTDIGTDGSVGWVVAEAAGDVAGVAVRSTKYLTKRKVLCYSDPAPA